MTKASTMILSHVISKNKIFGDNIISILSGAKFVVLLPVAKKAAVHLFSF